MLSIIVVVAPILFVLLTTVAILSFAPVQEEEPSIAEGGMTQDSAELLNQGAGAKIILFRPATPPERADSSTDEIVAHLEQELRQRQQAALELVAVSSKKSASAS